jgi:hypothetical protein
MLPRLALLFLVSHAACASRASPTPRLAEPVEVPEEPVEGPGEALAETAPPPAEPPEPGPEPTPAPEGEGWATSIEQVPGDEEVLSFRWLQQGALMFETEAGWSLYNGQEASTLDGDELEEAISGSRRSWEHPKFKWRVHFEIFWSEGNLKCEDLTGEVVARLEVCMRKASHRCNVHTFTSGGELGFPWSEAEAPSGIEALDLVAFPSKNKLLVGRRSMIVLLTLVPLPESPAEAKTKSEPLEYPCEAYASVLEESTFLGAELLPDLVLHTSYLTGTAYAIDGTSYLFGGQGGVWLGSFSKGVDPVLVVPIDANVVTAAWSPAGDRIAILDSKRRLHVAHVTPPGLPSITIEESAIK